MSDIEPIDTDEQHAALMVELRGLMPLDPAPDTAEGRRLRLLAIVIEDYEKKRWPISGSGVSLLEKWLTERFDNSIVIRNRGNDFGTRFDVAVGHFTDLKPKGVGESTSIEGAIQAALTNMLETGDDHDRSPNPSEARAPSPDAEGTREAARPEPVDHLPD